MPEPQTLVLQRLLSLLTWASRHPGRTVAEIARHFGRTRHQVRRDIETLALVGDSLPGRSFDVDWAAYEEQGVLTVRPVELPPQPALNPTESSALVIGLSTLLSSVPEREHARVMHAIGAVLSLTPARDAHAADAGHTPEEALSILHVKQPVASTEFLSPIYEAIARARVLTFEYPSRTYGQTRQMVLRRVFPRALASTGESWVLSAWDYEREAERHFRVDRMRSVTVGEAAPDVPETVEDAPAMLRLVIDGGARWVCEEYDLTFTESGEEITVEIPVWDEAWVVRLLVDIAPHIRWVDDEWAQRMRGYAREILARWERPEKENS